MDDGQPDLRHHETLTISGVSSVGGSDDFGSEHVGFSAGQFQPGVDGYIGFRLNGTNYGWMRVSLTYNDPGAVIKDWAYDDTGAAIYAGLLAIPEPSRALLLIGLTSLAARRRRSGQGE